MPRHPSADATDLAGAIKAGKLTCMDAMQAALSVSEQQASLGAIAYLDAEMGLLPETLALAELEVDENLRRWQPISLPSPIQSVDLFQSEDGRRLVINCEDTSITLETSFTTREIQIS